MALIPGVAAPDLAAALAPENEWRNISDVVRNSIKALHEIVLGQASRIAALEEEIAARPTRVTFEAQMRALEESFVHASSEASLQADRKMKVRSGEVGGRSVNKPQPLTEHRTCIAAAGAGRRKRGRREHQDAAGDRGGQPAGAREGRAGAGGAHGGHTAATRGCGEASTWHTRGSGCGPCLT